MSGAGLRFCCKLALCLVARITGGFGGQQRLFGLVYPFDVEGLGTLRGLHEVKGDFFTLIQNAVALTFNGAEMDEDFLFVGGFDESVALVLVEPLNFSGGHDGLQQFQY